MCKHASNLIRSTVDKKHKLLYVLTLGKEMALVKTNVHPHVTGCMYVCVCVRKCVF